MGLWAFATGTWIPATVIGGLWPVEAFTAAAPIALLFGGVAQFIAGLFAYRRAHALFATMFCCFGALYTTFGLTFLLLGATRLLTGTAAAAVPPLAGNVSVFTGFVIESFGFIALSLAIASLPQNLLMFATLVLLTIGYGLAGIAFLSNSVNVDGWGIVGDIGGYFMMASALCAYYAGMARMVNSTSRRRVMPIWGEP